MLLGAVRDDPKVSAVHAAAAPVYVTSSWHGILPQDAGKTLYTLELAGVLRVLLPAPDGLPEELCT